MNEFFVKVWQVNKNCRNALLFFLGETQFFYFPLHSLQKDDFLKRQIVKTGSRTFSPISPTPFLFYFTIFFS